MKKEESPIVVPLLGSGDKETKSESIPSLHYPSSSSSTSRASSWLSSYCIHLPAHHFWGDSSDSTYHPASIIRSPTPLAQPVDWNPVYNYGATTDTTIVPSSSSSETYINPIGNGLRQVFLLSEVSDLIREGLQLGLQQRAEEEHREQIWQRVLEARARVEEKLNREEGISPRHPPFPNLVPCCWFRGAPPCPFLCNRIAPLRPRESLRLPSCFRENYIHH